MNQTTTNGLSEKEAQIYDRQIRLWGVDAQQRISKTRILVYGITGLAAEICKNIVLAGVGTVHIIDDQTVDYQLLGTNFFINDSHVGKNRATASLSSLQELNPLVKVSAEEASISSKAANDDGFWSQFDMVFLTNCPLSEQVRVNDICRSRGILFFAADTYGLFAVLFEDLLKFDYSVKNLATKETKAFSKEYISLKDALSTNLQTVNRLSKAWIGIHLLREYQDEHKSLPTANDTQAVIDYKNNVFLKKHKIANLSDNEVAVFCLHARAELSAVCAQIGGIAAQEIIKVISRDAEPIDNFFVYDGVETFIGFVETIKPKRS